MNAIFASAVRGYADAGIATFPVGGDDGKKPMVKRPQQFGIRGSLEIAPKFPNENVGFWCGPRSKLTVVDIDSPKESELDWALATFGASPIIVRTGSGKHHVWYRHNGERRKIRPVSGHDMDLLGEGGLCVAPPSIRPGGGPYEFLRGSLADVGNLPTMRRTALEAMNTPPARGSSTSSAVVGEGYRNKTLFDRARAIAPHASSSDALLDQLRRLNIETNSPPLPDAEVTRTAAAVWQYKMQNRLFLPGTQHIVLATATVDPLFALGESDAALLLLRLCKAHDGQRDRFAASPRAMERGRVIGTWSTRRYKSALDVLCKMHLLERLSRGSRGSGNPARYRFGVDMRAVGPRK